MTPTKIECVGMIFLTALALAFFITVFVGLAKDGRESRRRRRNDRIAEEAAAIVAALFAYDLIREGRDGDGYEKFKEACMEHKDKKEEDHGKDEAL